MLEAGEQACRDPGTIQSPADRWGNRLEGPTGSEGAGFLAVR